MKCCRLKQHSSQARARMLLNFDLCRRVAGVDRQLQPRDVLRLWLLRQDGVRRPLPPQCWASREAGPLSVPTPQAQLALDGVSTFSAGGIVREFVDKSFFSVCTIRFWGFFLLSRQAGECSGDVGPGTLRGQGSHGAIQNEKIRTITV